MIFYIHDKKLPKRWALPNDLSWLPIWSNTVSSSGGQNSQFESIYALHDRTKDKVKAIWNI